MGDILETMEDFAFVTNVENAIINDLRRAGHVADVLWHQQASDHHVFRIVLDPLLSDREAIIETLTDGESESPQMGISAPYEKDGELLVWIKRPKTGKVYPPDEPDTDDRETPE